MLSPNQYGQPQLTALVTVSAPVRRSWAFHSLQHATSVVGVLIGQSMKEHGLISVPSVSVSLVPGTGPHSTDLERAESTNQYSVANSVSQKQSCKCELCSSVMHLTPWLLKFDGTTEMTKHDI